MMNAKQVEILNYDVYDEFRVRTRIMKCKKITFFLEHPILLI